VKLRVGVLTVSDGCAAGVREDRSGALLEAWVAEAGHGLAARSVVPDDALTITRTLLSWADRGDVDVILTTGGTGFGPRDVTPEATRPVLDREAAGLSEAVRRKGESATRYAPLSRGLIGARGEVVVANLPGSPGGVKDGIAVLGDLLSHTVALLRGHDPSHQPPEAGA
jgi:molybdopterin adenylyltransferase